MALVALVAVPTIGSDFGAGGPRDQSVGAEPGSEKARLVEQFQREYEAALGGTMAPPAGPPVERWQPVIVEGIDDDADNPFEGSDFELSNMWQSRLTGGVVTQVFAGSRNGLPVVILNRLEVMAGETLLRVEIPLPARSGTPRITAADRGVLSIGTGSGRSFVLDVAARELRAAD